MTAKLPLPPEALNPMFAEGTALQTKVNSSSLGPAKQCLRKYYYECIWGWRTRAEKVDLLFGGLLHQGVQEYLTWRVDQEHEEALDNALGFMLAATWNEGLDRPTHFDHPKKTREALIRTLVWYLDQFQDDPIVTIEMDGMPLVEYKAEVEGFHDTNGWQFDLVGTFDRVGAMNEKVWFPDIKTTDHQVDGMCFTRYSPGNQFSQYSYMGRELFPEFAGVICDAIQIGADFSRFQRGFISRDKAQLDEWARDSKQTIDLMVRAADEQYWPQNDTACGLFGGCVFRKVCGSSPIVRQAILERDFIRPKRNNEGKTERSAA